MFDDGWRLRCIRTPNTEQNPKHTWVYPRVPDLHRRTFQPSNTVRLARVAKKREIEIVFFAEQCGKRCFLTKSPLLRAIIHLPLLNIPILNFTLFFGDPPPSLSSIVQAIRYCDASGALNYVSSAGAAMSAAPPGDEASTWASSKCFVGHWGVRAASDTGKCQQKAARRA